MSAFRKTFNDSVENRNM